MGKYRIIIGDITNDEIIKDHDLIINLTNPQMVAGCGVSGVIFKKAGVDLLENYTQTKYNINYFSNNYNVNNIMKVGEVRITPGFNLDMDIMFVQGPKKWEFNNSEELLVNTYINMLEVINNKNYKNILLPSLGTGEYGFEHEDIGSKVTNIIKDYIKDKDINIDLVFV